MLPQVSKALPVTELYGEKNIAKPLKHLRLIALKLGRNGARSDINDKCRPLDPPVVAFPALHAVDAACQPSASEATCGSIANNPHPTHRDLFWRVMIVVVVFDGLPKISEGV